MSCLPWKGAVRTAEEDARERSTKPRGRGLTSDGTTSRNIGKPKRRSSKGGWTDEEVRRKTRRHENEPSRNENETSTGKRAC